MKMLKLPKEHIDYFASVIYQFGEVHAPVRRGSQFVFAPVPRWSDVCLDYNRTIIPPKKYVLQAQDPMFHFDPKKGFSPATEGLDKRIVLLGVHPCDIFGLNILSRVFEEGEYKDPFFAARRRRLAVIGVDCVPDDKCLCRSMRADFVDTGFDLFLSDLGDYYMVMVGTALGDDMVLATGPLFQEMDPEGIELYKQKSTEKREMFQQEVDLRDLPRIMEMEYSAKVWEELGAECLSCGSCSMVCPTCYCYDVHDDIELGTKAGTRFRNWDSCLFKTHAAVAGGENFREERASRIKFRYFHKQRGFVAEYGRPSCVGCGRCIETCPADINIVNVINRIRGEEVNEYTDSAAV